MSICHKYRFTYCIFQQMLNLEIALAVSASNEWKTIQQDKG